VHQHLRETLVKVSMFVQNVGHQQDHNINCHCCEHLRSCIVNGDLKVQWSNFQIPSEMDFIKYIPESCVWNIEMCGAAV